MATLTLRDVPEPVMRELRRRARRHGRSVQKELLSILEGAVIDRKSLVEQLRKVREQVGARFPLDQIHRAIEEGRTSDL